ncbi:hypothetical protein HZ320_02720 [[Pasteurella] aerogenes]|nr:hypothetical protein HZ320_02720 [[Pasteurella] aerogenes]
MRKPLNALIVSSLLLTISQSFASDNRLPLPDQTLVKAEKVNLHFAQAPAPQGLVENLKKGGYVIVFRYTGAGGSQTPVESQVRSKVIDDGQRISDKSIQLMKAYGKKYNDLTIPVNRVLSSEYYFVWQHAQAAFDQPIQINRDLTGSLYFHDQRKLTESLQNLRNRTVTPPDNGQNTVLFTHQGKFDKAYGYYIPAGTTIIFKPDGSSQPKLVAVLSFEEFMKLK